MSTPPVNASLVGTLVRVAFAGYVIAIAVGFPAFGVASATSGTLTFLAMLEAIAIAALGAGFSVLCMRRLVREIWTAWVGLLGGVMPASLAAPDLQLVRVALAHLVGGGLLVAHGSSILGEGAESASTTWAFFGMCLGLAGLGLGLGGALPRLWWAWRGGGVEQPDDTVSRHIALFSWLALTALSLSSGLAETLPRHLDPGGAEPLRRGNWARGCVGTLAATQDICPSERRFVARVRAQGWQRLEWRLEAGRACAVVVEQDGQQRRRYTDSEGHVNLEVLPGPGVRVTIVGLTDEGCHARLRVRPTGEGEP